VPLHSGGRRTTSHTQSAVRGEVDTLEERFGKKLIDRTNKFVRPTKAGEVLYHQAKDILTQYEQVSRIIADLTPEPAGSLSIGPGYTFGTYLLSHTIARFKACYPLITPKIIIMNSKRVRNKSCKGRSIWACACRWAIGTFCGYNLCEHRAQHHKYYCLQIYCINVNIKTIKSSTVQKLFDLHFQVQNTTYQQETRAATRFRVLQGRVSHS
jgi:hypothetical protein